MNSFDQAWTVLKEGLGRPPYEPTTDDWYSVPCKTCGAEINAPCTEIEGDPPLIMTKLRGLVEDPFAYMHPETGVHGNRMMDAAKQPGWTTE